MYEHESGLPNTFDRAAGKASWQSVVFGGERRFIQGAELNELQRIERDRSRRFGRLVAREGDRISGADAIVDQEAETVTLAEGTIYVAGDVFPVAAGVLADVPMTGRVEIGVRLIRTFLTSEDDPSLLGLVPGSLAEGEPGAAREVATIAWALKDDDGEGEFYSVYTLQDGTVLDQTGPSMLDGVVQQLAVYDRPNGNYIVSGCRATLIAVNGGKQIYSIEAGEANIFGFKRTRLAAIRHVEEEDWDEAAITAESHTYTSGATFTFNVDRAPIGVISSILLTKEKTVTLTRGAIAFGSDGLPDTNVISISEVKQGATTYVAGTDYNRVGNSVDWAPPGAEPVAGSTYSVTYRYRASVTATSFTNTSVTVSGGATGGEIIIAYTQKLPRIDRIGLQTDGSPIYLKGASSLQPFPPPVPDTVLALADISNDWMSAPTLVNNGTRSLTKADEWRYFNRVLDHDRLIALSRLQNIIDSREPVAKLGLFVDPFRDDTYRDAGLAQTGAIGNGMLQLAITPTFYWGTLTAPVMLDYTEEVIVSQELKTACTKINPYQNFNPLPGSLQITPAMDFWTEARTDWLSAQTIEFQQGVRTDGGPLQTTSTENQLVDHRVEQLEFLRQIPVTFLLSGFGIGEVLTTLTFDGINVKPAGTQVGDGAGQISGTFTIPANVTAGTKVVKATGAGGTTATAMFAGAGRTEVDMMRQVTTINTWTEMVRQVTTVTVWEEPQLVFFPPLSVKETVFLPAGGGDNTNGSDGNGSSDPQAQMFAVPETRQLVGVAFHMCAIGNPSNHLLIDQVTISDGYPTTNILAETVMPMIGETAGWKFARYRLPLTTGSDRKHAFVIKTDDGDHSVSLAKLGAFDTERQQFITAHPYVTGPRFSSVNAETWTAHQDEALAFRIVAAKFTATTKVVPLGSFTLVNCSDLQVRAAVELPSAGCSVVFEIQRTNGTIYRLLPFQVLQLTEFLNETVQLRAVLTGTEKLSPILFAPVQLVAGRIGTELTYVTRAFNLGTAVRLAAYLKAYLPGGATLSMSYSKDGGAFTNLPLTKTEALAFPLWSERKYEVTGQTGTQVRLKITGTGGPSARLIIGDLSAGTF